MSYAHDRDLNSIMASGNPTVAVMADGRVAMTFPFWMDIVEGSNQYPIVLCHSHV